MRPRTLFASTLVGSLLALAGTAAAQYPPPTGPQPIGFYPEEHEHNEFFARAYLGPQYLTSRLDEIDTKVTGGGLALGLAAGWAINPSLVLYGELFGNVAVGPEVDTPLGTMEGDDEHSFGIVGLGVGAAYYFMPSNAFVSATLGFAALSQDTDGEGGRDPQTSDAGPGVSLMFGKEWWISRHNALGVAGQVFFGSQPIDEDESDARWSTRAFGVVVTASYN